MAVAEWLLRVMQEAERQYAELPAWKRNAGTVWVCDPDHGPVQLAFPFAREYERKEVPVTGRYQNWDVYE